MREVNRRYERAGLKVVYILSSRLVIAHISIVNRTVKTGVLCRKM